MADDHVIDIRRFLGELPKKQDGAAFAVWGNGGERSRFALPLWRAIYLLGGNWGGIVSLSKPRRRGCCASSLYSRSQGGSGPDLHFHEFLGPPPGRPGTRSGVYG